MIRKKVGSVVDFMSLAFLTHRVGLSYFLGSHFSPWCSRSNIDQLPSWGGLSGSRLFRKCTSQLSSMYGWKTGTAGYQLRLRSR